MIPAIRIDNLSKLYHIGADQKAGYRTLREAITGAAAAPLSWVQRWTKSHESVNGKAPPDSIWALKNIALEIQPGEVVGVIGRNGAGKSTLLKVLSRITEPTEGRVTIRGRVGSLLEVGTGFHPELTGRENIYLNGAILGMTRQEIARKFDDIVAFAEIERFLDTPVKRYSSGMYVRLAFAVASHLEPEILLVDEVLAVGDIAFQHKCLRRIQQISRCGLTVLFVSHNMAAVESLCNRAILLERGRLAGTGHVAELARSYYGVLSDGSHAGNACFAEIHGPSRAQRLLQSASLLDEESRVTNRIPLGGPFRIRIEFQSDDQIQEPTIGVGIDNVHGQRILSVLTPASHSPIACIDGRSFVECRIANFPLAPGEYWIKLGIGASGRHLDEIEKALCFEVVNVDGFGDGRGFHRGYCCAMADWTQFDGSSVRYS
jgi:lipopolysaccharide transport system ATP-binding protein